MWHVSLSIQTGSGPLLTDKWSRQQRNEAQRVAARLLHGVGQEPMKGDFYPFSFQHRRCLTDAEMATLPPGWLEIPAVDEGGTPEEVRAALIEAGMLRP